MKICTTCNNEYADDVKFCPLDGSTLRAKSKTGDLVGQIIADRYSIVKKLGEGGMGAVYLGEHVKMGRKSAIKVMNPSMANDPDAISRFNREAANASRISHANVCQIYDFGESDGVIYLAMEFIEGQALTDLIEKAGALPAQRAAHILRQAADGLAAAHDLGMVHRDIKPDNIMIVAGRDGSDIVKVVDFGIAKAVQGDDTSQKVTKTGLVVGTPEYMSPEQLSGDKLDGRSDIYSLGLVLYRMLTGVLPFQADSAQETMIKRLTDDPMPLAEARPDFNFPAKLQAVLDKALARSAAERYGNATDFGKDTVAAVAGMAVPETRVDQARVSAMATQVMDTEMALKLSTKYQEAAKKPKAGAAAPAAPVAPPKKFPMVAAVGGGVAVVGVVAVVALTMMKGGNAANANDSLGRDSGSIAALPPTSNPDTAKNVTAPVPGNPPGTNRTPPNPGTNPPRTDTAKGTTPTNPPAPVASVDDSLTLAATALRNGQNGTARRAAMFVWESSTASRSQRSRAAQYISETYAEDDDATNFERWLQRAVDTDPNNSAAAEALRRLRAAGNP